MKNLKTLIVMHIFTALPLLSMQNMYETSTSSSNSLERISPSHLKKNLEQLLNKYLIPSSSSEEFYVKQELKEEFILTLDCIETVHNPSYTIWQDSSLKILSDHHLLNNKNCQLSVEARQSLNENGIKNLFKPLFDITQSRIKSLENEAQEEERLGLPSLTRRNLNILKKLIDNPSFEIKDWYYRGGGNDLYHLGFITRQGTLYYGLHQAWKECHKEQ